MYKFTNGIVVFDEKTRDSYIKAGYKLVKDNDVTIVNDKSEIVLPESLTQALENQLQEVLDENTSNDGTIEEKPRRSKKVSN